MERHSASDGFDSASVRLGIPVRRSAAGSARKSQVSWSDWPV